MAINLENSGRAIIEDGALVIRSDEAIARLASGITRFGRGAITIRAIGNDIGDNV